MHGRGVCVVGGDMHGGGHACWQEVCVWQGVCMAGGHA